MYSSFVASRPIPPSHAKRLRFVTGAGGIHSVSTKYLTRFEKERNQGPGLSCGETSPSRILELYSSHAGGRQRRMRKICFHGTLSSGLGGDVASAG